MDRQKKTLEHYDRELQERSVAFMKTPDDWPTWRLPLKHSIRKDATGFPILGFLLARGDSDTSGLVIVYLGNVTISYSVEAFGRLPTESFTSYEACVADGWRVD